MLNHDGEIRVPRAMQASPATFLQVLAPSRDDSVVAVACLLTWYGLADLWAHAGLPLVLGPAVSRHAIQGGTAKNDRLAARTIAVLLRGGMVPPASVSPAARRAPRARLRRRVHRTRTRAARLPHLQQPNGPYHLPALGTQSASKAHRGGGAERFPAPAVPTSVAGALALLAFSDHGLRAVAWTIVQTATPHDAHTLA